MSVIQHYPAMSDTYHLLALPMEIRSHTKTALFLSCRQLYRETLEYYYGRNTLSLPLHQRSAVSQWRFLPRHFDLIKLLHLEADTFFLTSSSDSVKSSEHAKNCQRRTEEYLQAPFWTNQASLARNLRTLIFADRAPTSHSKWYQGKETFEKRLEGYIQVFERSQIGVGHVAVEIKQDQFRGTVDESEMLD